MNPSMSLNRKCCDSRVCVQFSSYHLSLKLLLSDFLHPSHEVALIEITKYHLTG